jgi:hypothetical protein
MTTVSTILANLSAIVVTLAIPLLTFLGFQKFVIEPRYEANISRRKFATALYLACQELSVHFAMTLKRLESPDSGVGDAMKKIPSVDSGGNPAWFTKEGYYATLTAYKIATVSAWLRIYQNALLFSLYPESQSFLKELYDKSQNLKIAFSESTCLWYYYFDAIGERLIEEKEQGVSVYSFAKFCSSYSHDADFRLFFEQLHMYIWFFGNKNPKYIATGPRVKKCLSDLILFLEQRNLLPGFRVERPAAAIKDLNEAFR